MQILAKYKTWIFGLLVFMCLYFLIAQSGVWAYLDASYQFSVSQNFHKFFQMIFDITGYQYGGDWTQLIAARYIQIGLELVLKNLFGFKWGAIVLYLSYFVINYFFSEKVLARFIDSKYAYIGALVYTFNPLSIYMLNEVGFLYVYSAVPLIIYGFYTYFYDTKKYFVGLLLCALGIVFLTSYTRFMLIYILFFVTLIAFYFKDIWKLLLTQTYKCLGLGIVIFCVNLPFVFSVLYPLYSGEHAYFSGVSNYADTFKGFGSFTYHAGKNQAISELLVPLEPTGNFGYPLRDSKLFLYFSFLYFSGIIFFLLYKQPHISKKHKVILSVGILTIVLGSLFRLLPNYVSENVFVYVTYVLLPFLANNSAFSYRLTLTGISTLLPLALHYSSSRTTSIIISSGAIVYCFATASTLFFFHANQKLHTIDISESNPIYSVFHRNNSGNNLPIRGSLIYPSSYLLFDWAPYPLSIGIIPGFSNGVESNERTTPAKQMNFGRYIGQLSGLEQHITNLGLLNISSFLVMQNIREYVDETVFDFYDDANYVDQGIAAASLLSNDSGIILSERNTLYKRYDIKNSSLFSFSMYLPRSLIMLSGYDNLLDTGIELQDRPLFVDSLSYNRPAYIDTGYVVPYYTGQTISVKTSLTSPFSYYIKLSHVRPGQDILLQFNKTFGVNWKIQKSDKHIYDSIICTGEIYYPISNNSSCYTDGWFPSMSDFVYALGSENYSDVDHFQGNIIGNTRILKNVDNVTDGEVYILISNQKQYLFILSQVVATITLLILMVCILFVFRKSNDTPGKNY